MRQHLTHFLSEFRNCLGEFRYVMLCGICSVSPNQLIIIRKYVRGGVNPDHADFDGRTALHLACCGGRLSAVHVLVNEFHAFLDPVDLLVISIEKYYIRQATMSMQHSWKFKRLLK